MLTRATWGIRMILNYTIIIKIRASSIRMTNRIIQILDSAPHLTIKISLIKCRVTRDSRIVIYCKYLKQLVIMLTMLISNNLSCKRLINHRWCSLWIQAWIWTLTLIKTLISVATILIVNKISNTSNRKVSILTAKL